MYVPIHMKTLSVVCVCELNVVLCTYTSPLALTCVVAPCPSPALRLAQGTTIKLLVRLINVRLARTEKETLNESVHSAVSSL